MLCAIIYETRLMANTPMTNILAVLYLSFITNCTGVTSLPDGTRICEYSVVANVECNHVMPDGMVLKFSTQTPYSKFSKTEPAPILAPTLQPIPLPIHSSLPLPFSAASVVPAYLLPPRFANGGPDETNYTRMFRIDFPTQTNRITGQPEVFFDASNGNSSYRVTNREGVLP